jgi:cAMP-dependent protein kinase regulator
MSTFEQLIADLTRDANRVQPRDVLQYCANWFQHRLEEQRTRTRDALTMSRQTSFSHDLPTDHFTDTAPGPTTIPPHSRATPQPRMSMIPGSPGPFGMLDVPGNALLDPVHNSPSAPPVFQFHPDPHAPPDPLSSGGPAPNPFASFEHSSPFDNPVSFDNSNPFGVPGGGGSPGPVDYLNPQNSMIFARRTSVSAESIDPDAVPTDPLPVFQKSDAQLARIRLSISNNLIFRDLDEEQETGVVMAMQERQVAKDEVVILQGDVGEYFYVVESGHFVCYIHPDPLPPAWLEGTQSPEKTPTKFLQPGNHPKYGKKVADCKPGNSFGELALMYGHPRAATVMSTEPSTVWQLDRITFRTIILKAAHRRRTMYEQFLSSVGLLSSLSPGERSKIADALVSRVHEDGEHVVRQGDMGDTFFFVEDGQAVVTKDGIQVGVLTKGDYFGGTFGFQSQC